MSRQRLFLSVTLLIGWLAPDLCAAEAPVPPQRKPPRVLLFASAPTRDFQFLQSLLIREADKGKAEVSICLQPLSEQEPRKGVVLGVPPERMLKRFPDKFQAEADNPADKLYDLASYDVIVAFDPDWSRLTGEQTTLLARWVEQSAGGLIVVAGPIHTFHLARPGANKAKLAPVIELNPAELLDARLEEEERRSDKPFRLNFPPAKGNFPFLKLDAEGKEPNAGWEAFFGDPRKQEEQRGFYGCYPVKGVKLGAVVLATFADPAAKMADGKERPFLVVRPAGKGRVAYLGSGEVWRLREYREAYHERLWLGLIDYVRTAPEVKKDEKP
jgi:hypothetical protein